jgi:hypothetical protein
MDGRADMTKLTVAFRNFANAPKNDEHGLLLIFDKPAFFSGVKYWCAISTTDGSSHRIVYKNPRFVPKNFFFSIGGLLLALKVQIVQQYCHSADCGTLELLNQF